MNIEWEKSKKGINMFEFIYDTMRYAHSTMIENVENGDEIRKISLYFDKKFKEVILNSTEVSKETDNLIHLFEVRFEKNYYLVHEKSVMEEFFEDRLLKNSEKFKRSIKLAFLNENKRNLDKYIMNLKESYCDNLERFKNLLDKHSMLDDFTEFYNEERDLNYYAFIDTILEGETTKIMNRLCNENLVSFK